LTASCLPGALTRFRRARKAASEPPRSSAEGRVREHPLRQKSPPDQRIQVDAVRCPSPRREHQSSDGCCPGAGWRRRGNPRRRPPRRRTPPRPSSARQALAMPSPGIEQMPRYRLSGARAHLADTALPAAFRPPCVRPGNALMRSPPAASHRSCPRRGSAPASPALEIAAEGRLYEARVTAPRPPVARDILAVGTIARPRSRRMFFTRRPPTPPRERLRISDSRTLKANALPTPED